MADKPIDILLVEDNPADIRLAQETLRDYKLQNALHVVEDGDAALEFLRREGAYAHAPVPDIVLLDIALPKVDGFEVLRQMQNEPTLREIPVAILTVSAMDEQILKSFDLPADCYILKPLTLERFLDAVRCFPQMGLSIVKIGSA